MPHSTACSVLVCLPPCGHGRGNGARPREMADSRVLATARHIHICLRVAVLRDSSHFRGFRPAAAPTVTAQGILGNWANNACVRLSRALAAPSGFALRAQPTRRLRRGRIFGEKLDSSRALHPSSAARHFVGGIPPPRLARVRWRITRTVVAPFPCAPL